MEENIGAHAQPVAARLERWSIPEPNTGCFIWLGKIDWAGYGHIKHRGRDRKAATVAYEEEKGPVPKGLEISHRCGQVCCVNPHHLIAETHSENLKRRRRYVRKLAVCGHPLQDTSLFDRGKLVRRCIPCHTQKRQKYLASWARENPN